MSSQQAALLAATAGLIGFGLGALVFSPPPDNARSNPISVPPALFEPARSHPPLRGEESGDRDDAETKHETKTIHDRRSQDHASTAGQPSNTRETAQPEKKPSLERLLTAIATGGAEISRWVTETLEHNPELVTEALDALATETDPVRLDALATLLGHVGTPEVEQAALALARSDDPLRQAAAFELLDRLDTPRALEALEEVIRTNAGGNTALLARAIHALPPATGLELERTTPLTNELERLGAQAGDAEVRARALIALGDYGRSESETVLRRALAEADPRLQAAAAFALERLRPRDRETLDALGHVLDRTDLPLAVRENAFHALRAAGPLPRGAHEAYKRYLIEREGLGLGD